MPDRFCKNCKHYERRLTRDSVVMERTYFVDWCRGVNGFHNPVTGDEIEFVHCDTNRMGGFCGLDGKLFEPK
jgi:hypothetical protein